MEKKWSKDIPTKIDRRYTKEPMNQLRVRYWIGIHKKLEEREEKDKLGERLILRKLKKKKEGNPWISKGLHGMGLDGGSLWIGLPHASLRTFRK